MPLKMLLVAGARPNFMKVAPLLWEIEKRDDVDAFLVHTGQHYDERMSQRFFSELAIPAPDANLEVGSGFAQADMGGKRAGAGGVIELHEQVPS